MPPRRVYVIVITLSVSAVYADDLVDRADANGDGFVSLYELRAAHYADTEFNKSIEQSFANYDSNGDGLISEAERRAKRGAATAAAIPPRSEDPTQGASAARSAVVVPDEAPATSAAAPPAAVPPQSEDRTPGTSAVRSAVVLPDEVPATSAAAVALAEEDTNQRGGSGNQAGLSRTESWILEIDADNSGGASVAELVASGDGKQWFTNKAFDSADKNGDSDLDPAELEVLLQSVERRGR